MRRAAWILRVLASHWWRNPLQLAALLVGLATATALWSGVQALNAEAKASYDRAAELVGRQNLDRFEPAEGRTLDQQLFVDLRRAGWDVSPVLEGDVRIGTSRVRLLGIDPLSLPAGAMAAAAGAAEVPLAEFIAPPWVALAGADTIERLGLSPGARADAESGIVLPPLVEVPDLVPGAILTDIGAAQAALGAEGRLSYLLIDPDAPVPPTGWQAVAGGALVLVAAGSDGDLARLTDSFHLNLTAFGFLSFVVGLFIVHAAIGLAFEQRLGTVRTLRACGVSATELTVVLLAELVLAALMAGAVGVMAGYVLASLLLPDVALTLGGLYGVAISGSLAIRPEWWLAGLGMTLGGALVASAHTLTRAWTMPVLASARRQAWRAAQARTLGWQGAVAAAVLVATLAIWGFGHGLAAGFAVLAGLLLGAALLVPAVLAGVLSLGAARARSPLAQWAFADSRQQLSGLSLALMALLLALAANIGVGTMVDSFRTTFTAWLDQRLAPEVYFDPQDAAQEVRISAWLAARPEVTEVLPTRLVETRIGGWPTTVYGRVDAATYRESWPLLAAQAGLWDRIAAGEAALISEQLAHRLSLGLGDRLTLPTSTGPWEMEVAGIYPDYGNPRGQVSVAFDRLAARWPEAERGGTGLRVREDAIGDVIAGLRDSFELGPGDLIDQAQLKEISNRIFERTFAVTAMLNVLTLAVAGVALFASLLTLADLRLAQLAPLWAMGITRRRLAALECAKTLALALMVGLMAIPLGIGVAWLLVSVVNVEAFGWRLPLHLFPGQWAWLMALTAATAVLASALPALRLARMAPARLVKIFAEER